jgi:hypothetical protein
MSEEEDLSWAPEEEGEDMSMFLDPEVENYLCAEKDARFAASNPEPSVDGDEFGERRKREFEAAAAEEKRRWKVEVEFGQKRPNVKCVDVRFLTLAEAVAMRPLLIEKLSDVWWK